MSSRGNDFILIAIGAVAGLVATLALGAQLATLIATRHTIDGSNVMGNSLRMLFNPADPAAAFADGSGVPNVFLVWASVVVVAITGTWLVIRATRWVRGQTSKPLTAGMASTRDLVASAGTRETIKRASITRPGSTVREGKEAGYPVARVGNHRLWVSVEDSVYIWGPPRSGKTQRILTGFVLDAPGAAVITSTRPDLLALTSLARNRTGSKIEVFDPNGHLGVDGGFRWNLAHGCADPAVAIRRAHALASTGGFDSSVGDGSFWQGQTEAVLRSLLHAADLMDVDVDQLAEWGMAPESANRATEFLNTSPAAAPGWAHALTSVIGSHERQRDSVWMGVRQALGALANPVTRAALNAPRSEQFDAQAFLRDRGSLYILSTAQYAKQVAGVFSALVEDLAAAARHLAASSPGARLDPPLLMALDEVDKVLPGLPSLPALVADGGGSGITTVLSLQSLAQARTAWGKDEAQALWDASNVKVVLGGSTAADELRDISNLIGERDDKTVSYTHHDSMLAYSANENVRRIPIAPVDELRQLQPGQGIILLRSTQAGLVTLPGWWDRSDAKQILKDREAVEQLLHTAAENQKTGLGA